MSTEGLSASVVPVAPGAPSGQSGTDLVCAADQTAKFKTNRRLKTNTHRLNFILSPINLGLMFWGYDVLAGLPTSLGLDFCEIFYGEQFAIALNHGDANNVHIR